MSRLISRDPFARTELHSAPEPVVSAACNWCGSVRRTPKGKTYLNRYWTETDGGRTSRHPGLYCSVSCFRCDNDR